MTLGWKDIRIRKSDSIPISDFVDSPESLKILTRLKNRIITVSNSALDTTVFSKIEIGHLKPLWTQDTRQKKQDTLYQTLDTRHRKIDPGY